MTLGRLALLLPIATALLLWTGLSAHRGRLGLGRLSARGTLVVAFVVTQAVLLAITELLSLGHLLTTAAVAAAWGVVAAVATLVVVRTGAAAAAVTWARGGGLGRTAGAATSSPVVVVSLLVLVLTGATLVVMAGRFPPNNADSIVYHLTRVAHWAQEGSIAHFATHYTAQLELAPLHELNLLHLHLLAGTDRLDGFVQLAAFGVVVVAVAEVVRLLGAAKEVQVVAAVLAAATPSVLLEATSTQNNLFAAALGIALVMVMLAWEPLVRPGPPAVVLGLAAGLMVLTKGTTVPLLAPLVVVLGVQVARAEARQSSWGAVARRVLHVGAVATGVALLVAGPFALRNLALFDSTTGPITRNTMAEEVRPRWAAANTLRNTALHFRIGDGESGIDTEVGRVVLDALRHAYGWTDAPDDDAAFGYGQGYDAFEIRDYSQFERNEDYGASPWLVAVLALSLPIAVVQGRRGDGAAARALPLLLAGLAGFVLFSATTNYTPYGTRYQLPLLVLAPALVAVALAAMHRRLLWAVAAVLVVTGLPALLDSWSRPLFDQAPVSNDLDAYLAPRPDGDPGFVRGADAAEIRDLIVASGCTEVGVGNWVLFEYLLWAGLEHVGWEGRIEHVGVENASGVLEDRSFEPCAIVQDGAWISPVQPTPGMVEITAGAWVLSVDASVADRLPPGASSAP